MSSRALATLILVAVSGLGSGPTVAEVIAVTGGTVHTLGAAGTLEGATVLIEDGRIEAVGSAVTVPSGARIIVATGKVVTPGLFDAYSRLGLKEIDGVAETVDEAHAGKRLNAAFDVSEAINPRSTLIPVNRIEGITRALVAPQVAEEGHFIAGLGAAIHLGGPGDYLIARKVAMFARLGERGAELAGGSRAAAAMQLREALQDAQDYAANRSAYESGSRRDYAVSRLDLEAFGPVIAGRIPLVLSVDRASDIEAALALASEFDFDLVIEGGAEAWLVGEQLAAAEVPVILDPLENLPRRFERIGATLVNAARLHRAGVSIAFSTSESHNSRNLTQSAGNAVAHGLPHEAALMALTVSAARIYGLDDRYGTLEPGMDADVVVWSGDPLEVTTFADHVIIAGREMPMASRSTMLRDRYLELDEEWPPAYR